MKISQEKKENSIIALKVECTPEEKAQYEQKALKKVAAEIKIDGFRKGHVPESILKQKVGEGTIAHEAIDLAIQDGYMKALQESKVRPLVQPEVSIESMDPITFTVEVQVYPEVEVKEFESTVKLTSPRVTKKEIESQLEMFLKQSAENKTVERESKSGDIAVIDFDGKDADGNSQPGMKSEGHPLELGSGTFIPGFEESVTGMKAGEEKTFPITFPKDYNAQQYAGNEYHFTVTVQEVQEKVLPELTDEFAQTITGDKEKTVAGLEEEIKGHLKDQKSQQQYQEKQKELFDLIGKNTTAAIPPIFIEEEVVGMIDNIKLQGLYSGTPWEKHLENMGKTEEELKEELKTDAKKSVLSRLGLQFLIEKEGISVTEEEMNAEIEKELAQAKPEEKAEKAHSFEKNHEGWMKIENRLQIRKYFETHLN